MMHLGPAQKRVNLLFHYFATPLEFLVLSDHIGPFLSARCYRSAANVA
jgi:hypothetical protein